MGTPLTLPPSAKEYIDGMGMIVRRDEGEFLVTDQNFMALDEPRSLPKPAQRWQFREPILAGDRPLWILSNDLGIDGIEMSLFDPVALKTLYTKRIEIPLSKFRLEVSPSGQTWFVHNIATNKVIIVDTKSNVSIDRDLSVALKDIERPIIVVCFHE